MFIELRAEIPAPIFLNLGTPQHYCQVFIMPSKLGLAVLGAGIFAREGHILLVLV